MERDPESFATSHPNQTPMMLFAKPSTRTLLSFEAGMIRLGGHAIDLAQERSRIERGEPLKDVAGHELTSLAYLGDGNNVAHSLMQACGELGVRCTVATPPRYEPDETIRQQVEGTENPRE